MGICGLTTISGLDELVNSPHLGRKENPHMANSEVQVQYINKRNRTSAHERIE
jgi:hypothetical protein